MKLRWFFLCVLVIPIAWMCKNRFHTDTLVYAEGQTPSANYCTSSIPYYMYNNHFYICANGSPSQVDGGGTGTVSSVSVVTANGVSGTVATATTTPAITLALGSIRPTAIGLGGATTTAGGITGIAYEVAAAGDPIFLLGDPGSGNTTDLNVRNTANSQNLFRVLDTNPSISFNGYEVEGTPSVSGCSITAIGGGSTAGTFTSGTSGTCTVTITLPATNTGWSCFSNNMTTAADQLHQTGYLTNQAVIAGTTLSGDVITWGCMGW